MFQRVRRIAADILQANERDLTAESAAENVESWDSVRHLNLIIALEQEFEMQFEPEETDQMNSLGNILNVLESKVTT